MPHPVIKTSQKGFSRKKKEKANGKAPKVAESERVKAAKTPGRTIIKPKLRLVKRKVEKPRNPPKKRQKK